MIPTTIHVHVSVFDKYYVFYIDVQYECDNAFPNLKGVPELFSPRESTAYS